MWDQCGLPAFVIYQDVSNHGGTLVVSPLFSFKIAEAPHFPVVVVGSSFILPHAKVCVCRVCENRYRSGKTSRSTKIRGSLSLWKACKRRYSPCRRTNSPCHRRRVPLERDKIHPLQESILPLQERRCSPATECKQEENGVNHVLAAVLPEEECVNYEGIKQKMNCNLYEGVHPLVFFF